ncbi:hypothetical protein [Paraburkholderia hospita]|uniref:hypothetical protein n=1 Tax=Paraburkholderia hospita TaxID=169430 RepID=UPI000271BFD5|nr:hypothetical protein [Paraburkholderia hospita]EUC21480.1 hypothetical protein PMI06_009196 [Burkholderia sp. BT03]SKC95312.1 hypothetical protein SAMN06266956_6889 [Paraburkholderia hospita]
MKAKPSKVQRACTDWQTSLTAHLSHLPADERKRVTSTLVALMKARVAPNVDSVN